MEPVIEASITVIGLTLAAILVGVFGIWVYFLSYMIKSFKLAPRLSNAGKTYKNPKVSVILPARNEESYIARCLESLLAQDYSNFEIIAVNDSSTDSTAKIIQDFAAKDSRVVYVQAPAKPEGWAGKNWACYQGYQKATGEVFFFTDADTRHAPDTMSLAISHVVSENLDALTAIPRLICNDLWTKITLPSLSTFLHTRFSPLRVNDPNTKTGYFFGSFFFITKEAYKAVGTHEGVRHELVEDGALGSKVKEAKFRMKMFRAEDKVDAVWARDLPTLWHGLRRLVVPLYHQNKSGAHLMSLAVFFILFSPFAFLGFSIPAFVVSSGILLSQVLLWIDIAAISILMITTGVQCKLGVFESPAYALGSPLSGALISLGFLSAIVNAKNKDAVNWRDRQYTVNQKQSFLH
ncbi:MAG: glycosyl transferase [Nitrososphaera sp.]|nr:glycosyl transferase [Nitrososphaera sp.]